MGNVNALSYTSLVAAPGVDGEQLWQAHLNPARTRQTKVGPPAVMLKKHAAHRINTIVHNVLKAPHVYIYVYVYTYMRMNIHNIYIYACT